MPTTTEKMTTITIMTMMVRSKIARACGDCGWNTFTTSAIQNAALGSCRSIACQNTVTFNAIVAPYVCDSADRLRAMEELFFRSLKRLLLLNHASLLTPARNQSSCGKTHDNSGSYTAQRLPFCH